MNSVTSPATSIQAASSTRSVGELVLSQALLRAREPDGRGRSASERNGAASANVTSRTTASSSRASTTSTASSTVELSPQAKKIVAELAARDREVRAHEAAHIAAGGSLAGGASYTYQTGPDGRRYAVGGEVSIDTSSTGNPEEDLARAAIIRRAALAPAQPSGQDRAVAASATQMEIAARAALAAQRSEAADGADTAAGGSAAEAVTAAAVPVGAAKASNVASTRAYGASSATSGTVINIQA